jgi:hypothetical protein
MTKAQKIPVIALLGLLATIFIAVQSFNVYTQWRTSDKIDILTDIVKENNKNQAVDEVNIEANKEKIKALAEKHNKWYVELKEKNNEQDREIQKLKDI